MTNDIQVFVECGADLDHEKYRFTRKHFLPPHQTDHFRNHFNNRGVYQTVMQYINPIWFQNEKGKWLINAKDSYKWGDLYLDFDTVIESEEDYQKLKIDVKTAIRYLTVILNIDLNQIRFYYSGNKGIHMVISAYSIGVEPHLALNQVYKDIAKDIYKYCPYGTLDTKVYDDKRMFRMVNSYNIKGQRYKIPITYDEFDTLSYAQIRELATEPREVKQEEPSLSPRAKMALQKYIEEWSQRVQTRKEFTGKIKKLKELPPCIQVMLDRTFRETIDERNNSGTALASFFFQQGVEREEAMHRVSKWGINNCVPPLKESDTETIVNSVYNGQYRYGCETFKRLSGHCDKEKCGLFKRG